MSGELDIDFTRRNKKPRPLSDHEKEKLDEFVDAIHYSARWVVNTRGGQRVFFIDREHRYSDDAYEYRHVQLPKQMLKAIPKDYFDGARGTLKLLWEEEWRALGITQVRVVLIQAATYMLTWNRVWDGSTTRSMSQNLTFCFSSTLCQSIRRALQANSPTGDRSTTSLPCTDSTSNRGAARGLLHIDRTRATAAHTTTAHETAYSRYLLYPFSARRVKHNDDMITVV